MDVFTLNCWVRSGDDVFQVEISKTETISDLREVIKSDNAPTFCDVAAVNLALYKPKYPVSKPYKENLSKLILSEHGERLEGADELSEVFPEPPHKYDIHIIFDAPSKIICWLRGSNPDDRFPIPIQPGEGIERFIPRLKDAQPNLRNVAHQHIRLYRISRDENELRECLNKTGDGELLQGDTLAPNFLSVPVLAPLHVVVDVSARTRFSHPNLGGADPIAAAQNGFIKARLQNKSPSDSLKPSAFRTAQNKQTTQIPCGRPRVPEEPIPVTLLHPVFGQFEDDCHTGTMTEDDNQFIHELAKIMSDLYDTEAQRVKAVSKMFEVVHINLDLSTSVSGTNYKMDCSLSVDIPGLPPFFISEFKNEMASSNSEPYIQAVSYYLEATKAYALKQSKFALPCFLLIVSGPYMVFAGAVWNLQPVVQVLSTPLAFHYHRTDTRVQLSVARHMAAFRKALRMLRTCYEELSNGVVKDLQSCDMLFPCHTTFNSLEDKSPQAIHYTKLHNEGSLIFFGTLGDTTVQICIKFTQCYSKEAHLHCAKLGFAPKLRGFEVLPGGWYMIVMDDLVGYDLLADLPSSERLPRSVLETLETQLKTLHGRQLVHGDIRNTNIFIHTDDRTKFMIIDFDWAGVADVVQYPPYVNYVDVRRPQDARDGLPIKAAHDVEMLDFIIEAWATKNS